MFSKVIFATALISSTIASASTQDTWMIATPLTCKVQFKVEGKEAKELTTGELDTHIIINAKHTLVQQNIRNKKKEIVDVTYLTEADQLMRIQTRNKGTILQSKNAGQFQDSKVDHAIQITPKEIVFGKQESKEQFLVYRCPLTPVQWNRISNAQHDTSGGGHMNAENVDVMRAPFNGKSIKNSGLIVKNKTSRAK